MPAEDGMPSAPGGASLRRIAGISAILGGFILLGLFAVWFTVQKFGHPKLTETEMALWALERWLWWVPGFAAVGLGTLGTLESGKTPYRS